MSSFNDNNSGDKNNENNEDTSYFTFLAGVLGIFVLHFFIKILKKIFYNVPFSDQKKYINCNCSKCKERYEKFKTKIKSKNINKSLFIHCIIFLIFLSLFIECCKKVQNSDKIKFDPFEILEISEGASISEIKKSYKRLSLKYHPDKNMNDKNAKEKFIDINKAYRALTNEKAKENYRKYGNPDGPGLLQYGFALPFFLLRGKIGSYVIITFSLLMIIIFPIVFIKWFKNSKKYNSDGLLVENLPIYYEILNKDMDIACLPFVVGISKEFNDMDIDYDENEIKKLFEIFKSYFPKDFNYENISFKNMIAIVILYIHYLSYDYNIEDKFNKIKEKVIEKSAFIIEQIIKNIFELNKIYEYNKGLGEFQKEKENENGNGKSDNLINNLFNKGKIDFYDIKEFDFNLIRTILSFSARLLHETNINLKNNELLLFPHNKNNIKIFVQNNYKSISELIQNSTNENAWLQKLDNYNDIKSVISVLPKYDMDVKIVNIKYPEAGNLLTFNIVVTRGDVNKINSSEDQKELGFLHSNTFSDCYDEEIMIVIVDKDKNRVNYYEKIKFEYLNEEKKSEYSMLVENMGMNNFVVYLFSLSYPDYIIDKEISIEVNEENNLLTNFIKNRDRDVLSQEEFEDSYGLLNSEENEEIHEHQN